MEDICSLNVKLVLYNLFLIILFVLGPYSTSSVKMDSARQNLASSFVNGFVNAAFGKDKLLTEDGNKWIYKHNENGEI